MNKYLEMKQRHREEIEAFPMFFAFSNAQFEEGLATLGFTKEDKKCLVSIHGGGYIRRTDAPAWVELIQRQDLEMVEAVEADTKGTGFIYQMFVYELNNHEYCITFDAQDTIDALNFKDEDFEKYPQLKLGLAKARVTASKCQEW